MAPRLSARARKLTPSSAPPANGSVMGDNQFGDEAERVQLISIVSKLSAADDDVEAAKAPLKAAQGARKKIIGLGKAAGFTAKELEKRLDEMRMGSRDMALQEAREHKHRRWLGIIEPDQSALMLGDTAPQEAKDGAHWFGEGYKAGLRQLERKPPTECPERFVQPWLERYDVGLQEVLIANAPGHKGKSVAEQAAAEFKADNPEVDLDAAAKKLAKDPEFMARTPPEHDVATAPDGTTETAVEVGAEPSSLDAPFEATEEELQGQSQRRVVQEVREHSEPSDEVV